MNTIQDKDAAKNQEIELLREEVGKGFQQLASGEFSEREVMAVFEQVSLTLLT